LKPHTASGFFFRVAELQGVKKQPHTYI
jgi:hypothetical protein